MSPAHTDSSTRATAKLRLGGSLDRLKVWAIGVPIVLLLLLEAFEDEVLERRLDQVMAHSIGATLMVVGILAYSAFMWRMFQQAEDHLRVVATDERRQRRQLEALHEAALDMAADLDIGTVLQRVVESARLILGSRYGALAVVGTGGITDGFYTAGMDPELRARLGPPPAGRGLLGLTIQRGTILRVDDIAAHPAYTGFPVGHPVMRRLLAVPLRWQTEIIGSLYLTDTIDGQPFTADDEVALQRFAAHAATAIINARLYAQVSRLAVVEERERIAMDLHDGVIQSLYGASLTLDSISARVADTPEAKELDRLVGRLQGVIGDIRHYIFDLRQAHAAGEPLAPALRRLLAETGAERVTKQAVVADDLGPVPERVATHVWHIAHEALANAVRHSGATHIVLGARRQGEQLEVWVEDDGRGFDPAAAPLGHGVDHIGRRLEAIGGRLDVRSAPGCGTRITAMVPLGQPAQEEVQ